MKLTREQLNEYLAKFKVVTVKMTYDPILLKITYDLINHDLGDSSAVERSAVNREVEGSNPSSPAIIT